MLVLVLMGGPSDDPLPQRVADAISDAGGERVHVVIGAEAATELGKLGLKDIDLVTTPAMGEQLTAHQPEVVVIRLERRNAGGDGVIESTIWAKGHTDRHVAIAGKNTNPTEGAVNGILKMVGPSLPEDKTASADQKDESLAHLVAKSEWEGLRDAALAIPSKTPRQHYYLILALTRLGKPSEGAEALEAMRKAWPGHFLVSSAEALLKPTVIPPEVPDTGDTLRDGEPAPVPADESNVLK